MAMSLAYPGVYIEEVASGVRTITGVATAIAAFVGYTAKGEPDEAVMITSFGEFERTFGGLDRDSPVSYGVRQFFANGGAYALVVRVAPGHARATWELSRDTRKVLDVVAASPGTWANDLYLKVDAASARNAESEFNLSVRRRVGRNASGVEEYQTLELHRNLNMNEHSAQFAPAVVNNSSQLIRLSRFVTASSFDQPGYALSADLSGDGISLLTISNPEIRGTLDGEVQFHLKLADSSLSNLTALVEGIGTAIAAEHLEERLIASRANSDGSDNTDGNFLKLASTSGGGRAVEKSRVTIAGGGIGSLVAKIKMGLANGGLEHNGDVQHRPSNVEAESVSVPGVNGYPGGAADLIGGQDTTTGERKGMQALLDADLFNILCIPETFYLNEEQAAEVISKGAELCEARRAFYIVDAPSVKGLTDIASWSEGVCTSRNAAVYFPAVRIADPLDDFRPRAMPPSGTIAGIYARTDATRGVWKAPAGTDASMKGVVEMARTINDPDNGLLNPSGVNVLRSFPAYGRVVWGARTMRGADAQADEYKYIPVRRLTLFIEESLYRGTQWVVFEPNDEPLWAQIRLNIGAFMQNLFRQGAFQGRSPREAYFVKCDRETTTQNDINLGIVNIHVGFAPLKPAEFVVIRLQQMVGQVEV